MVENRLSTLGPMRLCLLCLALGLSLSANLSAGKDSGCNLSTQEILWDSLLLSFEKRDDGGLYITRSTANENTAPRAQALAAVLLEEWDIPPGDQDLQSPRLVVSEQPDYSNVDTTATEKPQSSIIVISASVDKRGHVVTPEVRVSSGLTEIDERCLAAVRQWLYRPALSVDGYRASKAGAICHLNLE